MTSPSETETEAMWVVVAGSRSYDIHVYGPYTYGEAISIANHLNEEEDEERFRFFSYSVKQLTKLPESMLPSAS